MSNSVQRTSNSKDKNITIFNSKLNNDLSTVDAYGQKLSDTINRLMKFDNTFSLSSAFSSIQGGLGMAKNVLNTAKSVMQYAAKAKSTLNALKNGNLLNSLNSLVPGAKSALQAAGISDATINSITKAVGVAVNIGNTVQKIKNGNLDILQGLSDFARNLTGVDIALIKDIGAIVGSTAAMIKEFSDLGISLASEWDKLVSGGSKGGYNYATEITLSIADTLAINGDYKTLLKAIQSSDPKTMSIISTGLLDTLFKEFSLSSSFNRGREYDEIFDEVMDIIKALRPNDTIWTPREYNRKAINAYMYIKSSTDWKKVLKQVMGERFFLSPETSNNIKLDYNHKSNEVFMAFGIFDLGNGNFKDDLNRDFKGIIINETNKVSKIVDPTIVQLNQLKGY